MLANTDGLVGLLIQLVIVGVVLNSYFLIMGRPKKIVEKNADVVGPPPEKNSHIEAAKEVARWMVFFIGSWIVTEMLAQATRVPEFQFVNVWVYTFMIPVRALVTFTLTMILRYIDKYLHVNPKVKAEGLLPF